MNWLLFLSNLAIIARPAGAWQYISPDALPSYDLSDSCKAALVVDLACPSQVASFFEREPVPLASLEEACTDACRTSLANFEAKLKTECGEEDVIEYELGSDPVHVSVIATDIYYHFTRTCIKDGNRWCNVWAFENSPDKTSGQASVTASVNKCDNCVIKPFQFQAGTSYSNGYDLQEAYASLTKSCSKSGFPLATTVTEKTPTTTVPTAPCSGVVYTVKAGDDCRSISKANGVSTSWMLYDNGLKAFCKDFPAAGGSICIVNKCKTYTVQAKDTCQSIAAAANITQVQLYTCHTICLEPHDDEDYAPITRPVTTKVPVATPAPVPSNIASGTNKNCAQFYSVEIGDYCNQIIMKFSILLEDFLFLNQGVNKDCTNLYAKESYCVSPMGPINMYPGHPDYVDPTTVVADINFNDLPNATFSAPAITDVITYLPRASGTRSDCHIFMDGKDLQYDMSWSFSFSACVALAKVWGISLEELGNWNPSLDTSSPDCAFAEEKSYCMAAYKLVPTYKTESDEPEPGTTTTTATTTGNGVSTPTPIQSGMVSNCNKFHIIGKTTTCQGIADYNKISISDFYKWNAGIKSDCSNLELGSYACAGIIASTSQPTTTAKPTTTGNGVSTPTPIQSGMVSNCNKFHIVGKTTTCQGIADYNKISISDFYKWNAGIKSDCSNLELGAYACAGVIEASQPVTTPKPTTTGNGISTPTPIQSGMVSNCNKFHVIGKTTTCQGIVDYNKITMANFLKWNTGVNSGCTNLGLGNHMCVGVIAGSEPTPTKTTGGVVTPTPTQAGMIQGCTKFHPVSSTTTCEGILNYNKISLAQFYKWNPAVKSDCSNLWKDTYACVAGP
ncbi:hypothetical protein NW767_012172 [Fusarium falciforme]|uniref:LysM domain-containing protein n=1 Tax=Fusarium falciforme TaxID=195108 RepID=A0A9W8UWX0_9HYPO|nr:hypothetical protein NW755_009131 [Fusarium falciforme]KAJ4187897.1 hypothetical protein NW767_012172 [Fusarium falciforme]